MTKIVCESKVDVRRPVNKPDKSSVTAICRWKFVLQVVGNKTLCELQRLKVYS